MYSDKWEALLDPVPVSSAVLGLLFGGYLGLLTALEIPWSLAALVLAGCAVWVGGRWRRIGLWLPVAFSLGFALSLTLFVTLLLGYRPV